MKQYESNSDLKKQDCELLLRELTSLRNELIVDADKAKSRLNKIHGNFQESARNLLHYLTLRCRDLRPMQLRLAALGLSSLGRAESHVMATVNAVLEALSYLSAGSVQPCKHQAFVLDFASGNRLLADHTDALLEKATPGRNVRIMVTMPGEAADDYELVHGLLQRGMECMRINCAHDSPNAWARMISHLRRAEQALGRSCRVVMDLAGPKLRTGPVEPGPAVVRIRPHRDIFGNVTSAARIWLTSAKDPRIPPTPADACLPVSASWLAHLRISEKVKLTDARNAQRTFTVVDVTKDGCWLESRKTAYIVPGTVLQQDRNVTKGKMREALVDSLLPTENSLELLQGDELIVTRNLEPGRSATRDSSGKILSPARIGCTIPEVFENVQPGESIWFDDGRIGGRIERVQDAQVIVRITQTRLRGGVLRSDKGINLPESQLQLPALTAKDLEDLAFVAKHADIVELSFANSARDVYQLQQHLKRLGSRPPAIVLKIETRRGFENLPDMLLAAMRSPSCGVMIARGDLAVESGFERLAEVQEEILWICEAAHVPVIWATQVLESLAKEGMPTRAEITDAAMAHRAECVMLNKGPHVLSAVEVLDDILRRMQAHQDKKRSMLRELHLAHTFSPIDSE